MALASVNIIIGETPTSLISSSKDGGSLLVLSGVAIAAELDINTTKVIYNLDAAVDIGITASSANAHAYGQIKDFYDEAPNGTELRFMLTDQTIPVILDKNNDYAKPAIIAAAGKVKLVSVSILSDGNETIVDGLDEQAHLGTSKGQELADYFQEQYKPLTVIIGGNAYSGVPADLKDYRTDNKNSVAMVIGSGSEGSKTADVGKLLGRLASDPVQRKCSRVKSKSIKGLEEGFMTDGTAIEDSIDEWGTVHDKGYIFYRTHATKAGVFYTGDPTLTSDTDPRNTISKDRTIKKALVLSYIVLVEELDDDIDLSEDGTMAPDVVKSWEGNIENSIIDNMKNAGEISSVKVFIDAKQNIVSTSKILVNMKIVPKGYAHTIEEVLEYVIEIN